MKKKYILKFLIVFFLFFSLPILQSGTWIETDYRIRFDFPRAWSKRANIKKDRLIITISKYNRAFVILETTEIKQPFNLDRFIEDDLDAYLENYDSVEVEKELAVRGKIPNMNGQSIYIVLSYEANGQAISDRLLYIRNNSFYYVFRFRSFRGEYSFYKPAFQIVVDSIKISSFPSKKSRNDSKFYFFNRDSYINDEYSVRPSLRNPPASTSIRREEREEDDLEDDLEEDLDDEDDEEDDIEDDEEELDDELEEADDEEEDADDF